MPDHQGAGYMGRAHQCAWSGCCFAIHSADRHCPAAEQWLCWQCRGYTHAEYAGEPASTGASQHDDQCHGQPGYPDMDSDHQRRDIVLHSAAGAVMSSQLQPANPVCPALPWQSNCVHTCVRCTIRRCVVHQCGNGLPLHIHVCLALQPMPRPCAHARADPHHTDCDDWSWQQ